MSNAKGTQDEITRLTRYLDGLKTKMANSPPEKT